MALIGLKFKIKSMGEKWKNLGIKDRIQYIMAILLIVSGIVIAFVSTILTTTIATGVLIYISEAFITAGGIFGVSIYFNSKLGEFSTYTIDQLGKMIDKAFDKHTEDLH